MGAPAKISDHAVIRYLERHYDIPIHLVRKEIREQVQAFVEAKALDAPVGNGLWAVIRGGEVVTILPSRQAVGRSRRALDAPAKEEER